MTKINKILIGILIISTLLIGLGYSAIENITLDIGGTATADPSMKVLPTGEDFNKILKGSTDTTITKIIFDLTII